MSRARGRNRVVIATTEKSIRIRGWKVLDLLDELGIKSTFTLGTWWADRRHLPDLCAYLEYRNIGYRMEGEE